jgi:toxin-antitoxin system PIN domain toxin
MIMPDANVLLYAYNASANEHVRARAWWEDALQSGETVGLTWQTITAFIRIGTNPRAFPQPYTAREAAQIVDAWLEQPSVILVSPGPRHWEILSGLLVTGQISGPLVMDAHLAALAIEHGAVLASTDRDFTRFPRLRRVDPLAGD